VTSHDEDIPLPVDLPAAAQKISAVSNVVGSASKWQLFKYGHHWAGKSGTAGIHPLLPTLTAPGGSNLTELLTGSLRGAL